MECEHPLRRHVGRIRAVQRAEVFSKQAAATAFWPHGWRAGYRTSWPLTSNNRFWVGHKRGFPDVPVTWLHGDVLADVVTLGSFDAVVSNATVHHLPDTKSV